MRKKTAKVDIIIIAVIILMIAGGILLAILTQNEQKSENTVYKGTDSGGSITYKDYIGKRIGIITGSSFEPITFEYLPDSEYFYYDSISDVAVALEQNKIDAFLVDEPVARMLHNENSSLDYIRQPLINDDYSFMFQKGNPKGDELRQQFNEMLAKFRSDGKLDEITNKWFGTDESEKTIEHTAFSGENGELVVDSPFDLRIGSSEAAKLLGAKLDSSTYGGTNRHYFAIARLSKPYFGCQTLSLNFYGEEKALGHIRLSNLKLPLDDCRKNVLDIAADISQRFGVKMEPATDETPEEALKRHERWRSSTDNSRYRISFIDCHTRMDNGQKTVSYEVEGMVDSQTKELSAELSIRAEDK